MAPVQPAASTPGARRATRIAFCIAGFVMAAWAPLVPFAKDRTGASEGMLGLLLLCLGIGSILAMPLAGAGAARFGCRRVIAASVVAACLALPPLATASSPALLIPALLVFGAGLGALDVAMNIQAITVERASGRPMMSGFHGLFSIGGILGAAGVTGLLGAGAAPLAATLGVAAAALAALAVAMPHLLAHGGRSDGPAFAWPEGVVLFIGLLCCVVFLAEGAMLDWGAVFLTAERGVEASRAGLGYVAFSLAMTLGRLTGDRLVRRFGGSAIITAGGVCAAAGFALATLVPSWPMALAGYALVGAGCANIVPVLFTAVGRQTVMPERLAVPAITTLGYAGILAGPAAIGFVAQLSSLPAAFLGLAVLLLGVAVGGRVLRV